MFSKLSLSLCFLPLLFLCHSATTRTPLQAYEDTKMSNFAYFFIASIFSLASVVGYLALEKLPFAQYYIKGGGQPPAQEPTDKSKPLLEEEDVSGLTGIQVRGCGTCPRAASAVVHSG